MMLGKITFYTNSFEMPLISTVLLLILIIEYFPKERMKLAENKMFDRILILSIAQATLDTVIQFICATHTVTEVSTTLYTLINAAHKLFSILYILIAGSQLTYILMISYPNTKEKIKKINNRFYIIYAILAIVEIFFTNSEVVTQGNYYTIRGWTIHVCYLFTLLCSVSSLIVGFRNLKKKDKRLSFVFINVLTYFTCSFLVLTVPGMQLYSTYLAVSSFVMYFTIENPDIHLMKQISDAKDQAEKANKAKTDFLSNMSHEIRTPLNAIVGLSEDIGRYSKELPEQVSEDSKDIIMASHTLLEIVGNILDISKIESAKMEIKEEPYSFKYEVNGLVKIAKTRIQDKPIKFNVNLANDIPYELIGDRVHIKEIINNLISNAIKYTDEGSITVNAEAEGLPDNCTLVVKVTDTGRGIKLEDQQKLFGKFERFDYQNNYDIEGTGLGLAITKQLVSMMDGTIDFSSEYRKGTQFTVKIPQKISKLTAPFEEESNEEEEVNVTTYNGKKILVVDDSELNIKVANRALSDMGLVLESCTRGKDCLEKINNGEKYDLILMDIMMPEMNGDVCFEELKKIPGFNTPVIALTADALSDSEDKYMEQGFTEYLPKPFSRDQIKDKLDLIFGNSKQSQIIKQRREDKKIYAEKKAEEERQKTLEAENNKKKKKKTEEKPKQEPEKSNTTLSFGDDKVEFNIIKKKSSDDSNENY